MLDSRMCSRLLQRDRPTRRAGRAGRTRTAAMRSCTRRGVAAAPAGGAQRLQHRQRQSGVAARRVDRRCRRRRGSAGCARRPGPTRPGPSARSRRCGSRSSSACMPLRAASAGSTQGRKSAGREIGERQQQVAEVALGVDDEGRDAVDRGLLEQRDAQAGLAAAGHADADRVRGQVLASRRAAVPETERRRSAGRTRGRGRTRRASRNPAWHESPEISSAAGGPARTDRWPRSARRRAQRLVDQLAGQVRREQPHEIVHVAAQQPAAAHAEPGDVLRKQAATRRSRPGPGPPPRSTAMQATMPTPSPSRT